LPEFFFFLPGGDTPAFRYGKNSTSGLTLPATPDVPQL
jgi:hypothetical protein